MSNHEERRKSLITLSNVIQAADNEKYKSALDKCESECEGLKSRISALESLLARAGDFLYMHSAEEGVDELCIEIDAILPATEVDKNV